MQADIEVVEFTAVRRLMERLTATPYGADAAHALTPAPDRETALRMQRAVTAARHAIEQGTSGLGRLPDIRAALRQSAQTGSALAGTALAHIAQLLQLTQGVQALVARYPDLYPGPAEDLMAPQDLQAGLDHAMLPTGRIRDTASPKLATLSARQIEHQQAVQAVLKKRLAELGQKEPYTDMIVVSGARLLLSVSSEQAAQVKGVRRGPAASGRQQLVEPLESVALNNRLEASAGERDAEELLVRRGLTTQVREAAASLEVLIGMFSWIDLAFAGGHLSVHMNASPPRLDVGPVLKLEGAYHPAMLLAFADKRGPQPVPLSVALDADHPMLLITGPNTGGKTVVLKTVGLLVTMAYCGLHLPTEGEAVVGNFTRLIMDIGDRQSLLHQLSTFAGHVEVLKRLLSEADADTLVLMDELGTGTDPEEGAALAMAVLDELALRQVRGIITTHLSPLKAYAAEHSHLTNATMRFDSERLAPTYQLEVGKSGSSHGLTIAERRGLSPTLLEAARLHLARIAAGHETSG
ncbi:MAG: endonuclease MutS2 [Acidiferrobacter sp.]